MHTAQLLLLALAFVAAMQHPMAGVDARKVKGKKAKPAKFGGPPGLHPDPAQGLEVGVDPALVHIKSAAQALQLSGKATVGRGAPQRIIVGIASATIQQYLPVSITAGAAALAESLALLKHGCALEPRSADVHAEYGRLLKRYAGSSDVELLRQASLALQRALELGLAHRGVLSSLIDALGDLGEHARAEVTAQLRVISGSPSPAGAGCSSRTPRRSARRASGSTFPWGYAGLHYGRPARWALEGRASAALRLPPGADCAAVARAGWRPPAGGRRRSAGGGRRRQRCHYAISSSAL